MDILFLVLGFLVAAIALFLMIAASMGLTKQRGRAGVNIVLLILSLLGFGVAYLIFHGGL